MARPVGADAEVTRQKILDSAVRLVAERGIEGASIRDIAAGAGISLATVLHYYGSKEGLYDACVDAMYVELDALRPTLFSALKPGTIDEVIAGTVRAALKFVRQHKQAHRILLRFILDEGGMRAERRERYLRPFLDEISALLSPILDVDPLRVRLTAQSIVHLIVRYTLHASAELKIITDAKTDEEAHARLEAHLIDVARAMLLSKGAV